MSQELISRSPDLKRLRDEGFHVVVRGGYLFVHDVPFLDHTLHVRQGVLVSQLALAGDVTARPNTHVAYFIGETPCDREGRPLVKVINQSGQVQLTDGYCASHTLSSKPRQGYSDYYEKMTTYIAILSGPAHSIVPGATARTYPVIEAESQTSPFSYIDTASSRAGIDQLSGKLVGQRVAIIGTGGTGSYLLDLIAKTPVAEIHIFDGDDYLQHNAFRSPGAPSADDIRSAGTKAEYYACIYSQMHRGVVPHSHATADCESLLSKMDFVFLCVDSGSARAELIPVLERLGVPFIDTGLGVEVVDGSLIGIVRTTTSLPACRERARRRIPMDRETGVDVYSSNVQVAELNALNAVLAVVKWKKLLGFYADLENEHHAAYTIDGNHMLNQDQGAQ